MTNEELLREIEWLGQEMVRLSDLIYYSDLNGREKMDLAREMRKVSIRRSQLSQQLQPPAKAPRLIPNWPWNRPLSTPDERKQNIPLSAKIEELSAKIEELEKTVKNLVKGGNNVWPRN